MTRIINIYSIPSIHHLKTFSWPDHYRCVHTALPVRVAHLQVAAGTCWVLLCAVWAADVLDLLAQRLQGGVDLQIAVAHHVGVVGTEVTEGIWGFLLRCGNEPDVESTAGGSGRSRRSSRSGRSLNQRRITNMDVK